MHRRILRTQEKRQATDDCSGLTVTYSDTRTGSCPEVLTRVWTAEDGCGNTVSCTQVITIDDTTPPSLTCPGDVTIDCSASTDPANTGTATATDDCSGVTVTYSDVSTGSCPEVLTRTWTAEDDCGNVSTCVQVITIDDTTPPSLTCPGDVTIDCSASTDPANTGTATATDDCSGVTVTYSDVSTGSCPEVLTRTWTAEDDCGNVSTCVQVITIDDTTPPSLTCPGDVTIDCSASTDPANTGTATATDDCSGVTVSYTDSRAGACPEVLTRMWTAEDDCGNVSTCVQVITIDDTTPPTITCPGDVTIDCSASTDPANTGTATATDDCSGLTVTYSDTRTGSCPEVLTRVWTAEDGCGNTVSCTQVITIDDTTPPTLTCPGDVTIDCSASTDPANTGEATATDDCSGVTVTYSDVSTGSCPEVLRRTWTAEDDCGNVSTCVQVITIDDTTPPSLTCPGDVTIDCSASTDPANTGTATATDDCSGVTVSYTDSRAGACPEIISRTWTAEDDCGNVSTCVQTITLDDTTPPTMTCPGNVTLDCGDSTDPSNTGTATATDDCSGVIITYSDVSSGSCPEILTRTWTAEDSCGNVSTCVQVITIDDTTPPTLVCPGDINIDCGAPTDPTNTGDATATDDCSGVTVSYTDSRSGSCPEILTRTWTAEDDCGNVATCVQVITIEDNTPPTLNCPSGLTIDCTAPTDPTNTGDATATDDCSGVIITYTDSRSGSCPEILTRTWMAEDSCGNVTTCDQIITIADDTPPVITCPPNQTVDCSGNTFPSATGTATATDDCSGVTITWSDSRSGSCPEIISRTWTAEDSCGNVATCVQTITLDDTTPPTMTCPGNVTLDCGDSTDPSNTGTATATDDCSGVIITYSDVSSGSCPEILTRTWTAEDSCGNVSTCVQVITIDDTTPPTLVCPGDINIDCGAPTDPTNTGDATATDDCSGVTVSYTDSRSGSCPEILTRTWMAEDDCGNVATCVQVITIEDNTPPTLNCPSGLTIDCTAPTDPTNTGDATATDDCSGVIITYTDSRSGSCPEILTRTWMAEDSCGNVTTCDQIITIADDTPPVITCPPNQTVDCSGNTFPSATGTATATDDCSGVTITWSDSRSGSCPEIISRTWTAEDSCGNVATCVQTITLDDTTPPTMTCPGNVTLDCGDSTDPSNTGTATATDDCSGVIITYSDVSSGSCPEILTRTWTAEDSCGNVSTCVQVITIDDTTPPTLVCPGDINIDCGAPTDPTNTGDATATDDCSGVTVSYTDSRSGSCPEILTRTWTAEDDCGNVATCVQVITIEDNTPPTLNCPSGLTIDCTAPTDPTNTGDATATDDCSGVIITYTDSRSGSCPEILTRTWMAEDSCGNVTTCDQIITIADDTPPVITCPPNQTVDCSGNTFPSATGTATATDDCSGVTITWSDSRSGSCPEIISRTWTAEDSCGNVATCVQTITLDDTTPPTMTCPGNVTLDCGDSTDPSNTGTATATDDCSGVIITYSDVSTGSCPEVLTRTWTAEDSCGNVTTCVQVITIDDTTPPTLVCPGDVNIDCGAPTDPTNTGDATATDDCSGVTVSYTDSRSGSCPEILTRTWTAEDDCGNVATCVQVITIEDNTPPTLNCPSGLTIDCTAPTDPTNTGDATATDDCSGVIITYTDSRSGSCPEILTRTWMAEDSCGNVTTCDQIITIADDTPPVITCPPNQTVDCSGNTFPSATGTATATDDCSGVTITWSDSRSGSCPEIISRTWTAEDSCGNVATCVQTITLDDTTPPTINCPSGVTLDCTASTDPSSTGTATATDDCSGVIISYSDARAGSCPEVLTRTWMAEDSCGNVSTCDQIITLEDKAPPTIVCPSDLTVDCSASTDPMDTGEASATDDCGTVTITYTDVTTGLCPKTLTRTWQAEDLCGNIATCDQIITINDQVPPSITCPSDLTLDCVASLDTSNTGVPVVTDNCSDFVLTYSDVRSGSCPETLVRTWTAEDDCGNIATCDQTITISDDTPPQITCPPDVSVACNANTFPSATGIATATDACGSVTVTYADSLSGSCPEVLTRTWTAEDDCGNIATCVQTISKVDDTPPTIVCPPNVTVDCNAPTDTSSTGGSATATDACGGVTISYTETITGSCPEILTRTWTAEDDCGNVATCDQIITIEDSDPPEIICPDDLTLDCGSSTDTTTTGTPDVTDDCSAISLSYVDVLTGDCPQILTRTWTAEDECGNVASCDQLITLVDNGAPTISCPPDLTVECMESIDTSLTGVPDAMDDCSAVTLTWEDVTSGNCPTVVTRTWTAMDGCDNTATCVQLITVDDQTPPDLTCPPDITLECGMSVDTSMTGSPTVTDGCSSVSLTFTDSYSGNCPETLTRTWTAEDECGNLSTCIQTITIEDTSPPVISCPLNITIDCGDPVDTTATGSVTVISDCSNVVVSYSDNRTGACPVTLTRTWTVVDDCGNVTTCDQIITVEDSKPPTLICPPDTTLGCGELADTSATGVAVAIDSCSSVTVTYSDEIEGGCSQSVTRTWTATDSCGNSATCVQVISVVDDSPPVITCPADLTVGCTESTDTSSTGSATATDDCQLSVLITYTDVVTGICPRVITRTFTADDGCGNIVTCDQTITIDDTIPPSIVCPPDVTVFCREEGDFAKTGWPTVADNCPSGVVVTHRDSLLHGECPGQLQRKFTATDRCGNSSTCIQIIDIIERPMPIIMNNDPEPILEVFQNDPNPWTNETRISFVMHEPGMVRFTLYNDAGKIEYRTAQFYSRGEHEINIDADKLNSLGVKYYVFETERERVIKQMIYLE